MPIRLTYGRHQIFRRRHHDVTVLGRVTGAAFPVADARFALNGAPARPLYLEQAPDHGVDWLGGYKSSPAELRCRDQGEFCVEIPVDDPVLKPGENTLAIRVEDRAGALHETEVAFTWDPEPPALPLDLRDLFGFAHVQQVGQAINGAFELDREANVIRSRGPVAPDAFLMLGPVAPNQEATYAVRFGETTGAKWLGLADFFAGLAEGVPPRGIRVGWCSGGMAAMSPTQGARAFLAWGDHSGDPREWAIATDPAAPFPVVRDVLYRVRHQIATANGVGRVRYRIWPEGESEPEGWLCVEEDRLVPARLPRNPGGGFGLFQHMGHPIEWSDILVTRLEPDPDDFPGADPSVARVPFLRRERPGAF